MRRGGFRSVRSAGSMPARRTTLESGEPGAGILASDRARRVAFWLAAALLAGLALRELAQWVLLGTAAGPTAGASADVEGVLFDPARNPPWLVFLTSAALVLARWGDLRDAAGAPGSPWIAGVLVLPALALAGWAHFVAAPDLLVPALVLGGLGIAYAAAGGTFARCLVPPMLLLLFAMPLPGVVVNAVVFPFQLWTASYAAFLLQQIAHPTLQLADTLRTASEQFIVIEECSGLGSMEVLTVLALAYAWFTRAPWPRVLALGLAAPAIAYALNGFRVVLLVLDPDSKVWSVHTTQGLVVFAVGALAIALLDMALARFLPERRREPERERGASGLPWGALGWLAAFAALAVAVPRYDLAHDYRPLPLLPDEIAGYEDVGSVPLDDRFLGSVEFTRWEQRRLTRDGHDYVVLLADDDRLLRFRSLRSPKNRVPGSGWGVEDPREVAIPGGFRVDAVLSRIEPHQRLTFSRYWNVAGFWEEAARALLALDQSPFRRGQPALLLRVHTEIGTGMGAARRAELRLRDLLVALNGHLATLTREQVRRL